ncbi:MAG: hypothetical protein Q4G51_04640 [Dermatophilus congolensis]|nr:hypothetical protein [Dermatophilus congolensis]
MAKKADKVQGGSSVVWLDAPEEHDFLAAAAYLALVAPPDIVAGLVGALRTAPTTHQKAKDILRASELPLLGQDNAHVASDLRKVVKGTPLSPVLVVRGDLATGRAAAIADGYHRVCASYHTDENTDIPVRLVAPPNPTSAP